MFKKSASCMIMSVIRAFFAYPNPEFSVDDQRGSDNRGWTIVLKLPEGIHPKQLITPTYIDDTIPLT